jgi:hypothetical protein
MKHSLKENREKKEDLIANPVQEMNGLARFSL